jgi:DNA anti-recombination protein RmuC
VSIWTAAALVIAGIVAGIALAWRRRPRPGTLDRLQGQLDAQAAELRRVADQGAQRELASEQLRTTLEGTRRALDELRVRDQERRAVEAEDRDVVRRLATVLAGGSSKGRPGEHVLRENLAALPPDMLVTDFRVNGKVVEFGLRLPDGRRLPIDSKWTALAELEALDAATDPVMRDACARAVEKAVAGRAKEVAQYLDPSITAPVAIAAVPDAAYAALKRAHADAYTRGVVVVPYSGALPIILFLYALVRRFGDTADVQAAVSEMGSLLDALEAIVENRFQRAAVMVSNGVDEFRAHLGKARGSLSRAHAAGDDGGLASPGDETSPLTVVG